MSLPSAREYEDLIRRVRSLEDEVKELDRWRARAHGIASVLGFIAGLFSAAIVTAIFRAIGA